MEMHLADGRQVSALTIAGSDSGGNAGVQADIRAFHTFGVHACTVFTALTAQNPFEVTDVLVPPRSFLEAQLAAVLPPMYTLGAVKTGMLATREVIECVAATLRAHPELPVVVDPVMVATSGARLIAPDAIAAVRDVLAPCATLLTPNLPEAEELLGDGTHIVSIDDMKAAARRLAAAHGCAVLVKGGHSETNAAIDILALADGTCFRYETPRVEHPASTHGTGCSLSAAIAAAIACGASLPDAVRDGKAYVYESVRTSLAVGERATVLGMPENLPRDLVKVTSL